MDLNNATKETPSNELIQNAVRFDSLPNHKELTTTIWGDDVKQDVFERWSQGFNFDKKEPTALLQYSGGPCSVITAVEAFLLKELLFCVKCESNWREPNETELNIHLVDGFLSIFINVSSENPKYLVFYEPLEKTENITPNDDNEKVNKSLENEKTEEKASSSTYNPKRAKLDNYDQFTKRLRIYKFNTLNELKTKLYDNINEYKKEYGVLCFLYSLLLTKDLDLLKKELEESGEPLIDSLHGHGSQALLNLMLCGIGTNNCFDDYKNLEGLKLQGIPKQSVIGFLTIMEYLRYCEVGWNLKNPYFPVWILASETHLTVFFSQEKSLIQKDDTCRQKAIKKFQVLDPLDNGFVKTQDLDKLMESLDLLTDKEYIECVKQQLDVENLGIITKIAFLNEFYPESEQKSIPNKFTVYHYNGLAISTQDYQVKYAKGLAEIIDFTEQTNFELNSIKNCLQTKWPTIEIEWCDNRIPSLN